MTARIVLFALDDLRARYGGLVRDGADPRQDTTPFRAFRAKLLDAVSEGARADGDLTMWWEGGFNGYALALALAPVDAVPELEAVASRACPVEASRTGEPRPDRLPLARVGPRAWELARGEDGLRAEAPFGKATGHFGAPGMRRVP